MKNTRTRGLTFIEIIIVMAILAVVMVIVYLLIASTSASAATQTTIQDLDSQCRQIMEEVTKDLREADGITVLGAAGTDWQLVGQHVVATRIQYMKVVTTDPFTGAKFYSGTITLGNALVERPSQSGGSFELAADGVDDDRNGLIDDGAINRQVDVEPAYRMTSAGTSRFPFVWPAAVANSEVPRWGANQNPPAIYFAWVDSDGPLVTTVAPEPLVVVVVTLQGRDAKGNRLVRSLTSKVTIRND